LGNLVSCQYIPFKELDDVACCNLCQGFYLNPFSQQPKGILPSMGLGEAF